MLLGALALWYAIATRTRAVTIAVLSTCVLWIRLMTLALLGAAIFDTASHATCSRPAYVACACWASVISLQARET